MYIIHSSTADTNKLMTDVIEAELLSGVMTLGRLAQLEKEPPLSDVDFRGHFLEAVLNLANLKQVGEAFVSKPFRRIATRANII